MILYPEEIAKIINGKKLLAHAVIEDEGTKAITNNSFIDAQYAWNAYSIYSHKRTEKHFRNSSVSNDCWLSVGMDMQHDYVSYCCIYVLHTQQAVLVKVCEPVINDYFDIDFYICDLMKPYPLFEQVESFIRYYINSKLWVSMPKNRKTSCGMDGVYKARVNKDGVVSVTSVMFKKGYRTGTDYYGAWDINA